MINATQTLESAKFFARDLAVNQPLTATDNVVWYKPEADVALYFTDDQGSFVILGDDALVSDDEIFGLFEAQYQPVPAGWVQVSH